MLPKWRGQTVVILGGGASLTGTALRYVARAKQSGRCRVIAVNDAVYLAWWADWLHAADAKWWHANIDFVKRFEGLRTTVDCVPQQWRVYPLEATGPKGFDRRAGRCRGNNSGYQALHCAIQSGASRIVLVGFDMRGPHWFEGPADRYEADYAGVMLPHFKTLRRTLKARGVEVVNCSPGSALICFPQRPLETIFGRFGFPIGEVNPALLLHPAQV